MRRRLIPTVAATLVAVTLSSAGSPALAFDKAGHFYTAYALARTLQPKDTRSERLLVALCAQLPDMAADLDAAAVYRQLMKRPLAWARWGWQDTVGSERGRKMITIQQLLHALTGGDAKATQAVALASTEAQREAADRADGTPENATKLCAYGFSLHFLGDSVAHRRMRDANRMYATGRGHLEDMSFPDYPLCGKLKDGLRVLRHCHFDPSDKPRYDAWRDIWGKAVDIFDPGGWKADEGLKSRRDDLERAVAALGPDGTDWNHWQEGNMQQVLGVNNDVDSFRKFINEQKSDRSCKAVLADALNTLQPLKVFKGKLECGAVWKAYSSVVLKAFADNDRRKADAQDSATARQYLPTVPVFEKIYLESPLDR
jgi:hypothetical protein